jgi:hypothetical protein
MAAQGSYVAAQGSKHKYLIDGNGIIFSDMA